MFICLALLCVISFILLRELCPKDYKHHQKLTTKEHKMIIARITGGIGNQLFIYAASNLALKNNCDLVLDNVSGFAYDKHYNRQYKLDHFNIPSRKAKSQERLEPFSRIRRYVMRKWNSKLSFSKRKYITEKGNDFQSKFLNGKLTGKVYLKMFSK